MRLRHYLETHDETLTSLADRAGVALSTLRDVASGRTSPSVRIAARIVDATGGKVDFRDLADETRGR